MDDNQTIALLSSRSATLVPKVEFSRDQALLNASLMYGITFKSISDLESYLNTQKEKRAVKLAAKKAAKAAKASASFN